MRVKSSLSAETRDSTSRRSPRPTSQSATEVHKDMGNHWPRSFLGISRSLVLYRIQVKRFDSAGQELSYAQSCAEDLAVNTDS